MYNFFWVPIVLSFFFSSESKNPLFSVVFQVLFVRVSLSGHRSSASRIILVSFWTQYIWKFFLFSVLNSLFCMQFKKWFPTVHLLDYWFGIYVSFLCYWIRFLVVCVYMGNSSFIVYVFRFGVFGLSVNLWFWWFFLFAAFWVCKFVCMYVFMCLDLVLLFQISILYVFGVWVCD